MKEINIKGKKIGALHKPFIIAELSGNHNQSLDRALLLVDLAAEAGVDAVKLQTYTADTMTLNLRENEFFIEDPNSLWHGQTLYELYHRAHTPWEWHAAIFDRCHQKGLIAFSTPFDSSAVDFLETLDVPLYKIASFENRDLALIKKIAATRKPIILSTGLASLEELDEAVRTARLAGCEQLILLKCTSEYPAATMNSNLATIPHMQNMFGCEVGLSDHTKGIGTAIASVALGASVIEKHFTVNRQEGGVDAAFSLEPHEMTMLVNEANHAREAIGQIKYGPTTAELPSLAFRRSLYIVEDMQAGEVFSDKNVRAIRPGLGLAPKYLTQIIGKRVTQNVVKGTALTNALIGDFT